jgi:transcriptional regulator with XRE-family HTH domain
MPFHGDRLRLAREAKNLTQRELARVMDYTEFQISRYETGKNAPSAGLLERLARQLEVSTDYLLGLSDDPQGGFGAKDLDDTEQQLLGTYRREGWRGVIHLGADRIVEREGE